jgi:tetratricopeptide (TPR) repeat protein
LSKHQFTEAYYLFRKAYFLNPKETWRLYFASEILFRGDMTDLAEQWIQRALNQETHPQLHHLMECYHLMWRRRFASARGGFAELPPETHLAPRLEGVVYSVSNGLLYCAVGLKDWPAVIDTCKAHLDSNRENHWARVYLALGLQTAGRQTEARQIGEEVLKHGVERLERPAQPDIPWDVHLYVAWAYRSLGRQHEAYRHLREYLTHRTLLHMPLGLDNPILDVFEKDPEFNTLRDDLKLKLEVARRLIREHETASTQD